MSSLDQRKAAPPAKERRKHFMPRLTEEHVQAALDYLMETADYVEEAVAEVERAEENLKVVKARAFRLSGEKTEKLKEADALDSVAYQHAIDRLAEAKAVLAGHRDRRNTAALLIEAWRTAEATRRANRI